MSPPTLGTLRSCFSWSGTLREFSRTPSPSTSTTLQQFRRKSEPHSCLPEACAVTDTCNSEREMSGDKSQPLHELGCASWSQESIDSTGSLNASSLSQPSSKDSDSEVIKSPSAVFAFSLKHRGKWVLTRQLRKFCHHYKSELVFLNFYSKFSHVQGWRDGSVFRSTDCSSRQPRFSSQHPCGSVHITV